jgi:hypothetical protein
MEGMPFIFTGTPSMIEEVHNPGYNFTLDMGSIIDIIPTAIIITGIALDMAITGIQAQFIHMDVAFMVV